MTPEDDGSTLGTMGRTATGRTQKEHVAVRLEVEQVERIDALIPHFSAIGYDAKRSDVLRALFSVGLVVLEDRARRGLPMWEPFTLPKATAAKAPARRRRGGAG